MSHYGGTKTLASAPQFSTNTAAVDNSFNAVSQSDMLKASQTSSTALGGNLGIAAIGMLGLMKAKNSHKSSSTTSNSSSRHSFSSEKTIWLHQASRELQNKLLQLLSGDRELAMRLLSQVKMNNPSKPTNWCVEKVIYDLERDRAIAHAARTDR